MPPGTWSHFSPFLALMSRVCAEALTAAAALPFDFYVAAANDRWALAMILLELVTGKCAWHRPEASDATAVGHGAVGSDSPTSPSAAPEDHR